MRHMLHRQSGRAVHRAGDRHKPVELRPSFQKGGQSALLFRASRPPV
jgi:hypothetical protein